MTITERALQGVFEVTLVPRADERGFFMRTYDQQILKEAGVDRSWVQENHARSLKKGTVRGLHFQLPPQSESKLIRVIRGRVYDAFVDLRKDSSTFGKWDAVELSEDAPKILLIPRGFAHGYCALSDMAEMIYKVDSVYSPELERGIRWNDPDLGIPWPVEKAIVSEKDRRLPSFRELEKLLPEVF